jgi:dTDP-glucose 4,6-dehydratase
MKNILVTGGAGFIGHHTVEHLIRKTDWNIVIIDKLSYASFGLEKLKSAGLLHNDRVKIITWDLVCPLSIGLKKEIGRIDYILHIAAESDVNRSIADPVPFIQNNINSTLNMLEYARELPNLEKFYMFSTDETRGVPEDDYAFTEDDSYHPRNPYSASKAACEMICMAYENTYKIPVIISEMVNCIGQRQHVEKFLPKVIKTLLDNKELIIHADPTGTIPGSRYYIHARNTADAVLFLLRNGSIGESYNICTKDEIDNLSLALQIADIVGIPLKYKMVDFHSDRLGHDLIYRLDGTKLCELGWKPPIDFYESLRKTVEWYLEYPQWLEE